LLFIPLVDPTSRESLLKEIREALQKFYSENPSETVNYGQIHQILHEIIKNTIDHSGKAGVLGLKMEPYPNGRDKFSFTHCELGIGITQNLRTFFSQSSGPLHKHLNENGGIGDYLKWAFTPNNTTKPHSGVNAGLGLSTINAAAKGEWIRLYLSDARSIVYVTGISNIHSHAKIRETVQSSIHTPCFMYFGHTT
jgi:hypothetical protein